MIIKKNKHFFLQILPIMVFCIFWNGCQPPYIERDDRVKVGGLPRFDSPSSPTDPTAPVDLSIPNSTVGLLTLLLNSINGNSGTVFVRFPTGTTFTIINGDLATTGTFTTTNDGYGLLVTGLSGTTEIVNGQINVTGSFLGIYKYLGTDYAGGTLQAVQLQAVNTNGTLTDPTLFDANAVSGSVGDIANAINLNVSGIFGTQNIPLQVIIAGVGSYVGESFTGTALTGSVTSITLSAGGTGLNAGTITFATNCLNGYITGNSYYLDSTSPVGPILLTNAFVTGTTTGGINEIVFTPNDIATGTFNDDGIISTVNPGSC